MLYRFEAIDGAGRPSAGTTEAGSPADARAALRERGLIPCDLEPVTPRAPKEGRRARGVSWLSLSGRRLDLLTHSTRHLALLLRTGVPLAQALQILSTQIEDRPFRQVVEEVGSRVKEGAEFHEALSAHPKHFPELYVHVARAGVQAGELPKVLLDLAVYYTRQKKIRDRVVSAITYPALMCVVGALVLVFLLAFVVPKVTAILLEENRALPWPTEVLLAVTGAFAGHWWAIVPGGLLLVFGLGRFFATERGRRLKDRALLGVPVLGQLLRKQIVARWAGTMSALLGSGLPVAQSLSIVRGAVANAALEGDLARVEKEVLEGASLSEALKRSPILPASVGFVAGIGEESGELDQVLREVAESYTEEVEVAAGRLTDLLNPLIIVVLGLVVGFIVAAILLPITDFSTVQ